MDKYEIGFCSACGACTSLKNNRCKNCNDELVEMDGLINNPLAEVLKNANCKRNERN